MNIFFLGRIRKNRLMPVVLFRLFSECLRDRSYVISVFSSQQYLRVFIVFVEIAQLFSEIIRRNVKRSPVPQADDPPYLRLLAVRKLLKHFIGSGLIIFASVLGHSAKDISLCRHDDDGICTAIALEDAGLYQRFRLLYHRLESPRLREYFRFFCCSIHDLHSFSPFIFVRVAGIKTALL